MSQAKGDVTPVRWRESTGWELRCQRCAVRANSVRFWPLTDEFWDRKRGMKHCRACWDEIARAENRRRYHSIPALRERNRVRCREQWASIRSDPVALSIARERNRAAQQRYRDRKKAA